MLIKRFWTYGSIAVILVLVFFSDLLTPHGVAVWLGYVLPLFLLADTPLRRYLYGLAILCCVLLLLGAFYSHRGMSPYDTILNRALFSLLLFFYTYLLTRRANAEEARRLVEEKFAKAFASSPVALGITRFQDGRVLEVNDTCLDMFGYTREEVIGSSTLHLHTWPTPQDRERRTRELVEKGRVRQCEQMLRKKSGELFVALASAEILTMGSERMILSTWIDITERKRAEEELQRVNQDLIRSNKDLEHFAYVASHDLQEPLRMVTGHLGMLAKRYQGKLGQDADEFIRFASDGAKRMSEMIQGLLEFSRVGRDAKPPIPVDSRRALEQALKALDSRIRETGAAIIPDDLPIVLAEEVQLGQVFQNLIGNALKFRREEVQTQIHIGAERRDKKWVFFVADNGIGIEPKFHSRVFDLFERLHAPGAYPGSGMGLAICRHIIEQWGGEIYLESKLGEGTTFFFTLAGTEQPG